MPALTVNDRLFPGNTATTPWIRVLTRPPPCRLQLV